MRDRSRGLFKKKDDKDTLRNSKCLGKLVNTEIRHCIHSNCACEKSLAEAQHVYTHNITTKHMGSRALAPSTLSPHNDRPGLCTSRYQMADKYWSNLVPLHIIVICCHMYQHSSEDNF